MTKRWLVAWVTWSACVALFGCGGTDRPARATREPRPEPSGESPAQRSQRDELYIALARQLHGKDCDQYASVLGTWVDGHRAEITALDKELGDKAAMEQEVVEAFEAILAGAADCVDHDEAQAAFDAFDELFLGG
jgi:hypothetical protein